MLIMSITNLTMNKCPICTRHVSLHAKQVRCCVCLVSYHMECLSLRPEDHPHIYSNADTWHCPKCLSEIFPDDDDDDGLTIVYSTVYSDADQRKNQSSALLVLVRGIHRWPVNSPHKWPVTRKMFPFDDVIMFTKLLGIIFYRQFYYLTEEVEVLECT